MKREDLLAPKQYNLVSEMEKYCKKSRKSCCIMGK